MERLIGEDAFSGCTSLVNIEIPKSVTSIGDGAFRYCTSLTGIEIPDGVTIIGKWVFQNCTSPEMHREEKAASHFHRRRIG